MSQLTDTTKRRLGMLVQRCVRYKDNPQAIPLEEREELSMMFAATFKSFPEFAELGMQYLGFKLSEIQYDIAHFMQHGQSKRMVQAQRGQAKSTLAALYCIWRLIHNPSARILIVSGGERQASDVALFIQRIIMQWGILCWLRPDTSKGDRNSVAAFDVHHSIKGIEKSPSVACVGITANLQGMRADFILADDIETQRNSMTQTEREKLLLLTKEFAAIAITGEIMYLGTPQTKDSVYRSLPARGYDVRVWCGRYPTNSELERYGAGVSIAPMIMRRIELDPSLQIGGGIDGTHGLATDPAHINEHILQEKELEYGSEGFSLQYMLDTTLSDALRTKIKISDLIVLGCGYETVPEKLEYLASNSNLFKDHTEVSKDFIMYNAVGVSDRFIPFEHKVMVIDPAGSGGDEVGFTIGGATNSYIYLLSMGGFAGGMTEQNMNKIILKMVATGTKVLDVEMNMGHGTVSLLLRSHLENMKTNIKIDNPEFKHLLDSSGLGKNEFLQAISGIGIGDYHVTGQKERRIIDTISPVTRRHKIVISTEAIREDWEYCQQHRQEQRKQFSCIYQLGNITYDRNSLVHDDRADTVQRVVEVLKGFLTKDADKAAQVRNQKEVEEWLKNPMGYDANVLAQLNGNKRTGRHRVLGKRGRRR
jgi:hypothetical protein